MKDYVQLPREFPESTLKQIHKIRLSQTTWKYNWGPMKKN
jgi:hypothetical protein